MNDFLCVWTSLASLRAFISPSFSQNFAYLQAMRNSKAQSKHFWRGDAHSITSCEGVAQTLWKPDTPSRWSTRRHASHLTAPKMNNRSQRGMSSRNQDRDEAGGDDSNRPEH